MPPPSELRLEIISVEFDQLHPPLVRQQRWAVRLRARPTLDQLEAWHSAASCEAPGNAASLCVVLRFPQRGTQRKEHYLRADQGGRECRAETEPWCRARSHERHARKNEVMHRIGPAADLAALGVVPSLDLPGVGSGLADHPHRDPVRNLR